MKTGFILLFLFAVAAAKAQLRYVLNATDTGSKQVAVAIELPLYPDSVAFVIPRYIPGHYSGINYPKYVRKPEAVTEQDSVLPMAQFLNGPRWTAKSKSGGIKVVRYTIDVAAMERGESVVDASVFRPGFACLFNYSVAGFVEGFETMPLQCTIKTASDWPVFTTIHPAENLERGTAQFACSTYYQLADGQTLMGPRLRVKMFASDVLLFVANYSEGEQEHLDNTGWQMQKSLAVLKDYFGAVPFPHYTVVKVNVVPLNGRTESSTAMEHLTSSTLIGNLSAVRPQLLDSAARWGSIFGVLHHMGHAFIPLRCYGDAYKPYVGEMPLLIKNVWFNEGFVWAICLDTLKSPRLNGIMADALANMPPALRKLDLISLSQLGSTQYGEDFRIGTALFTRGATMAKSLDAFIKQKSGGKKSMRHVYRYLFAWAQKAKRAFTMEEFSKLLNEATGVDVSTVYGAALRPLN